ncbi:hypothetical protein MKK88_18285 [Methylobacterium sp. E-005]|uniref:hypothetical protein n=1 Tax=Methylobacterium sp. E-005 TaxID=2836549 RepID=UPI001FB8DAB7|nr:hypothetical protein [Methylobacterium sp. E-005]MCJ2087917.1 hypothetical protein [Methylobacterium sp. E-005]
MPDVARCRTLPGAALRTDRMASVMTLDSPEEFGLKESDTVHLRAKAVNVLRVKP